MAAVVGEVVEAHGCGAGGRGGRGVSKKLNVVDWWPCLCIKRAGSGRLAKIKLHSPNRAKCTVCGVTKADVDRLMVDAEMRLSLEPGEGGE